jgi:hypothetical protein
VDIGGQGIGWNERGDAIHHAVRVCIDEDRRLEREVEDKEGEKGEERYVYLD